MDEVGEDETHCPLQQSLWCCSELMGAVVDLGGLARIVFFGLELAQVDYPLKYQA